MRPYSFGFFLCMCFGVLSGSLAAADPRPVKVGGYDFPPFAERNAQGEWSGLSLDLIELLNRSQTEYQFSFSPTSASRRHHDFDNDRFDLVFFESPRWGWASVSPCSAATIMHLPAITVTRSTCGASTTRS